MKSLKIAMILVAAVAFFCSCGEKTVTITMTEANETLTYDLASAATLPLSLTCTVKADAGIKTIAATRTTYNGEEAVKTVDFLFNEGFEGQAEYTFEIADTLMKAELVAGYTVVYNVSATDKKDNAGANEYTITITESANPIAANWSAEIILSNQNWATYNGTAPSGQENETIGVKYLEKNDHKAYNLYAQPTEGASWVFVENIEGLTTDVALAEAFNNGEVVTGRTMFPANDNAKAFQEKYFICKNKNNEYVLVDYVAGNMSATTGNVMVFKYKKAETAPVAAK
jgi:hypothetical protein